MKLLEILFGKSSKDDENEQFIYDEQFSCAAGERGAPPDSGESCMIIERIFESSVDGAIILASVVDGEFKVGDKVYVDKLSGEYIKAEIAGMSMFRESCEKVWADCHPPRVFLKGVTVSELQDGDMIIK